MFSKRCSGYFLIGVLMFAASCGDHGKSKSPVIQLQETAVPPEVSSAAGEVAAFQATGEPGKTQQVDLPLDGLRARIGKFDRVVVYEFSGEKRLSRKEVKVAGDSSISGSATAGNRYLAYADLGERYRNSYQIACLLGQLRLRADLVPQADHQQRLGCCAPQCRAG